MTDPDGRWLATEEVDRVVRAAAEAVTRRWRAATGRLRGVDERFPGPAVAPDARLSPRAAARFTAAIVAVAALVGVAALPGLVVIDGVVSTASDELFATRQLPAELDPPPHRSRVVAIDGSHLAVLAGEENRVTVALDEIPDVVRDAVVAVEDAGFREHAGVNHRALMRALVTNLVEGGVEQGGSTITQQYVKNTLLTPEQTVDRKLQEAVLATRLERELTKDEILERYLNLTYFGNGVYGIATAAEFYFGKTVGELAAPEAAMLAGMIRSPESHDPTDPALSDQVVRRRDHVLDRMEEQGKLTAQEAEAARGAPLELDVTPLPPPAEPFFVEYVKQILLADPRMGDDRAERAARLFGGGLEVRTSLNPYFQQTAHQVIADHLDDPVADPMGGLISLDPHTGMVSAMAVGPKGFGTCPPDQPACGRTNVNPLVAGHGGSGRQAGSTFKAILDTAALEAGIPTSWHTDTSPTRIEGCGAPGEPWEPNNYSGHGEGSMDMPEAVQRSNNVFHAKLTAEIGPQAVVDMAHRMGIDTELQPFCSLGLGAQSIFPIDLAQAFGVLASGGTRCEPLAILEVRDRSGEVLLRNEPECERVIDQETADTMTTMLQRVVEGGTATAARLSGREVAGKTGTTDENTDAWFVGYVPSLVTAAWLGFEHPRCAEGQEIGCGLLRGVLGHDSISGGTVPTQMWQAYMQGATAILEPQDLPDVDLDRWTPPPPKPEPDDPRGGGGPPGRDGEGGPPGRGGDGDRDEGGGEDGEEGD